MSECSRRFTRIADVFSERMQAAPDAAWGNPSPCEGWVARDVVRHLVEWVPGFFTTAAGLELPPGPSVDDALLARGPCCAPPSSATCRIVPLPGVSSMRRWVG
jgi:Mycothiol maleylpyruvate isomerase N-terminal domain